MGDTRLLSPLQVGNNLLSTSDHEEGYLVSCFWSFSSFCKGLPVAQIVASWVYVWCGLPKRGLVEMREREDLQSAKSQGLCVQKQTCCGLLPQDFPAQQWQVHIQAPPFPLGILLFLLHPYFGKVVGCLVEAMSTGGRVFLGDSNHGMPPAATSRIKKVELPHRHVPSMGWAPM